MIYGCTAFGQATAITVTTEFIKHRKWQQASHYIDSVIRKNPKDVDALMMKGNVILNYALDTTPPMQFAHYQSNASIFTGGVKDKPRLLAPKTVYAVERLWRKCLLLDSTRADISKGLCTIYAMALMRDSLEKEIVRLMKIRERAMVNRPSGCASMPVSLKSATGLMRLCRCISLLPNNIRHWRECGAILPRSIFMPGV